MKLFSFVFACFFICSVAFGESKCQPQDSFHKLRPKVRVTFPTDIESIVSIETECERCTGWVAGPNVIVTAAHCFEDSHEHITATFVDKHKVPLTLVKLGNEREHSGQDVAILKGNTGNVPAIEIEKDCSEHLQPCMSIGYGPQNTQKSVACYGGRPVPQMDGLFVYAGEVDRGDSGGPVINSKGKVIGVQVSITEDMRPVFFAVPSCTVSKFLNE